MEYSKINTSVQINVPRLDQLKMKQINLNEREKLPNNMTGVYFLFNELKELIYIGKTLNFKHRIKEHLILRLTPVKEPVCYYSFLQIEDPFESKSIELIYLTLYKTKYNSISI